MEQQQQENEEEEEEDTITSFHILLNEQQKTTLTSNDENTLPANQPLTQNHPLRSIKSTVVIRQLPSQGLSFQLWPAATTLVSLLDKYRSNPSNNPLTSTLSSFSGDGKNRRRQLKILELGSGTGIVGIVAGITLGAHVTVTDLPHVVENIEFNVNANGVVLGLNGGAVSVKALRWGHVDDVEGVGRDFDVVLGSDLVYHDHLYGPLIETLRMVLLGERCGKSVFVMAHLRRWKKESVFFKKARKLFDVDVLYQDEPCEGSRVGVVVYRFVGKG